MNIFKITIQRKYKDSWLVVVEHNRSGELLIRSEGALKLKPNNEGIFDELGELVWNPTTEYGEMLGKALFYDELRDAFTTALATIPYNDIPDSDNNQNCLHVLLHVEDEELRQLRWEKLCAPLTGGYWDYLLLNQKTPLSLYIPSTTNRSFPPIGRRDFQALVVAASPEGLGNFHLASFDVQATVSSIKASLGDIPCDVLATVDGAVGLPTLDNLANCLVNNEKYYTVLHLVCHGKLLKDKKAAIYLADKNNQVAPVEADELIKRLKGSRRLPHFAFLSTCESASAEAEVKKVDDDEAKKAQIGEVQAIGGLAQRLIRELGMPAVVAMTELISIKTAEALAATFYKQLRQHGYVDLALVEATAGLQDRCDITVPALFSRLGGRPLFSDTLERPLTIKEIEFGLERLQKLLVGERVEEGEKRGRAPVLGEKLKKHIATLQRTLNADSDEAKKEKNQALAEVDRISLEVLERSFQNLALDKPVPSYDARCPFQGLYPFRYENREFFCGREELIKELQQKLSKDNFVILSGASGSGKSSLVMAKLIPELQKKEPELVMAYMTPKYDPLAQLKASLAHVQNQPHILVIDQFEEVFTLCNDKDKRQNFIDELLKLDQNQRVIITVRIDFSGECAAYPELRNVMEKRQKIIAPMNTAELRSAIDEQAGKVGLRFEADLLNNILDDLEGEPGAMPLLQHALKELWEKRHGRWLLSQEYRAIGGVRTAIANTANGVYNKLLPEQQEQIRNIFVRLTHLDENPIQGEQQRRDTRRRVELEQLVPANEDLDVIKKLVTLLANERLVITSKNKSTDKEEVEVAHEALIRYWQTLRDWLDEDIINLLLRQRIENEAREWEKAEKKEELLLFQGSRLEDAVLLSYSKNRVCLDTLAREYVHACQQLQEKREVHTKTQLLTAWSALAEARFGDDQLGALVYALKAGKLFQQLKESPWLDKDLHVRIKIVLHQILHTMQERNRWEGEGDGSSSSFSSDSQLLATSGNNGTAYLWNLQGQRLASLKGHTDSVRSVSLSPDGKLLATAGEDGIVCLWDWQSQQQLKSWKADQYWLRSISFSPDGQQLATVGGEGIAHLWNLQGQRLQSLQAEKERQWLWCLSFSPDGQQLATVGGEGIAHLWNLQDQRLTTLKYHAGPIRSVSFSPNGRLLATAGDDGNISLCNLQGELLKHWKTEQIAVWSISFSPDGQQLATAGTDGTVRLWDLQGQRLATQKADQGALRNVNFSADSQFLITTGDSGTIRLWDLQGQSLKNWKVDKYWLKSISFSPNGEQLATAGGEGIAHLWNLQGDRLASLEGHTDSVRSVSFSRDGKILATAGDDDTVRLWNFQGQPLKNWEAKQSGALNVSFSANGKQLATAGKDGTVCLWNLQGQLLERLEGHQNISVWSISFSQNGQLLAATGNNGTVRVWDLQSKQLKTWGGHSNSAWSISFSPDGQLLATAGDDGTAKLWNLQGEFFKSLKGHNGIVWSVSFSPSGQLLATAGDDGTVRLWDLQGQQLAVWAFHTGGLWSISFSPDGQLLATAGKDGDARLLRIESFDDLMQRGCNWVRDYLTNNPNVSESDETDRRLILDGKF